MEQHPTLTNEEFKKGLDKLQECFPNAPVLKKETVLRYWEYIAPGFTDDQFKETIETIIKTEIFFPAISTFTKNIPQTLFQKAF